VPAKKRVSDEVLLRYNGMLSSVFELLADARSQMASMSAAIDAQREFWVADTDLQFVIHGGSLLPTAQAAPSGTSASAVPAAAH